MKYFAIPVMNAAFWCFVPAAALAVHNPTFVPLAAVLSWAGTVLLYLAHQWMHSEGRWNGVQK